MLAQGKPSEVWVGGRIVSGQFPCASLLIGDGIVAVYGIQLAGSRGMEHVRCTQFPTLLSMLRSLRSQGDLALLILRVSIGAIFLYHGLSKWGADSLLMQILSFVEPIAGVMILVGALSELAALILAIVMVGATYMKMTDFGKAALDFSGTFAKQGGAGWEFDLIILAGCLVILTMGAGKFSADALMKK